MSSGRLGTKPVHGPTSNFADEGAVAQWAHAGGVARGSSTVDAWSPVARGSTQRRAARHHGDTTRTRAKRCRRGSRGRCSGRCVLGRWRQRPVRALSMGGRRANQLGGRSGKGVRASRGTGVGSAPGPGRGKRQGAETGAGAAGVLATSLRAICNVQASAIIMAWAGHGLWLLPWVSRRSVQSAVCSRDAVRAARRVRGCSRYCSMAARRAGQARPAQRTWRGA